MNVGAEYGPGLNDLAYQVAIDAGGDPASAFLYTEVIPGCISTALFKDSEDRAIWIDASRELTDKIWEIWCETAEENRWSSLQLSVADGQFSAKLGYENLADEKVLGLPERQLGILEQRFGDKPIEYPDWEATTDPNVSSFTLGTGNES